MRILDELEETMIYRILWRDIFLAHDLYDKGDVYTHQTLKEISDQVKLSYAHIPSNIKQPNKKGGGFTIPNQDIALLVLAVSFGKQAAIDILTSSWATPIFTYVYDYYFNDINKDRERHKNWASTAMLFEIIIYNMKADLYNMDVRTDVINNTMLAIFDLMPFGNLEMCIEEYDEHELLEAISASGIH